MALKRDLLLIGIGRLIAIVFGLLTIRAMTTFLTPTEYGGLALLMSVQMFCGLFLVNPIGQHINLHTHAWWDNGSLLARLKSYRLYVGLVALVGSVAVTIIGGHRSLDETIWTAVAAFAVVAAGTWNTTLIPMLNMLGFRGASVFWSAVTVGAGLLASISLVSIFPVATAWFGGQAIGMTVGALGAAIVLRKNAGAVAEGSARAVLVDRQTVMNYCLPLAVATGFMWLQVSGYRFVIERYWGLAQLGFLVVGLQLAAQVWALVESLAMQFLYPLFYRRISADQVPGEIRSAFSDLFNTLVPVYIVITGVLIGTAPALLKLLVAPKFQDAVVFVILGAGIELCRVVGNLLSNAAHARRATKSLALPYAVGSIAALGLIYCAASMRLSLMWSACALLAAGGATFLVMLQQMQKQVRIAPDLRRLALAALAMIVAASAAALMPGAPDWRGAALTLVAAAGVTILALFGLLRTNPAMHRMVKIKLRNN